MDISSKAMGLIAAVAIVAGGGGLYAGPTFWATTRIGARSLLMKPRLRLL
ncbi:hypothetical protein [Thalassobacillus sp. C254]|nr:hypothetical protein [Thalassobacillus sp. C254]